MLKFGNRIHEIGYTIRRGKGLYVDTMIVKFVTRFLLFNNSSHRLAYGQKYETHEVSTYTVEKCQMMQCLDDLFAYILRRLVLCQSLPYQIQ